MSPEALARQRERRSTPEYRAANVRRCQAYRLANPEKVRRAMREYHAVNKERLHAKNEEWRKAHKDEVAAYQREYRKQFPEQIKSTRARTRLKLLYGLTPERLEEMKRTQNFSCAICSRQLPLVVDHCHSTGKVRELLCVVCNQALGMLQDSIEVTEKAKQYLIKHQTP